MFNFGSSESLDTSCSNNAFVQIRSVTRTKMESSYKFALSKKKKKSVSRVALKKSTQITMVKNRRNC